MIQSVIDQATGVAGLIREGTGDTLVFLHGIGSNAESFRPVFEQFPDGMRLVAWNAPGYGGSRHLETPRPMAADYAQVLDRFLRGVGVERATIIGHSLGTLIGARFAQDYPARVQRLVLAASACGYRVPQGQALPDAVAKRITDLDELGPSAFAKARAPRLVFRPEENPSVVAQVEGAMARVDPAGYAQAVWMLGQGDLEECLSGISVPCDFIYGVQDVVTPLEQTNRAARAADRAGHVGRVLAIENAGHAMYLQQTATFIEVLLSLLDNPVAVTGNHSESGVSHV